MQANLWKHGDPIPIETPLFYRTQDEPFVRSAINSSKNLYFPQIIEIKPNGERILGLIHAYLIAETRNDYEWLNKVHFGSDEYPIRSILIICAEITRGLQEHLSEKITSACFEYNQLIASLSTDQKKNIPSNLSTVINYVADLACSCLRSLEYGSPFQHSSYIATHKGWWNGSAVLSNQYKTMRLSITKKFGLSNTPNGLLNIENWLSKIEGRFSQLVKSSKSTEENAIFEASAYCSAMAERHLLRGNCSLAILFLHRSADLLMMKVCCSCIDFTKNKGGGAYSTSYASPNNTEIRLLNSVRVADSHLLVQRADRNDAFNLLNNWRNLLIQTHYMSDITDSTAIDIFRKVRSYLEDIGGPSWKSARDVYLEAIPIRLKDLLDVDGSLSNTFTVIDIKTWS